MMSVNSNFHTYFWTNQFDVSIPLKSVTIHLQQARKIFLCAKIINTGKPYWQNGFGGSPVYELREKFGTLKDGSKMLNPCKWIHLPYIRLRSYKCSFPWNWYRLQICDNYDCQVYTHLHLQRKPQDYSTIILVRKGVLNRFSVYNSIFDVRGWRALHNHSLPPVSLKWPYAPLQSILPKIIMNISLVYPQSDPGNIISFLPKVAINVSLLFSPKWSLMFN